MPTPSRATRETILEAAAKIISDTGAASLTFQTLGDTLGVSKQAVIYWFPSKADLARELIVPALRLEADTVVDALKRIRSARRGIEVFVRTLVAFHMSDLGRFRLIYAVAQFDPQIWQVAELPRIADNVHETTGRMYAALERILEQAPDFADHAKARVTAAAAHTSAVGLLSMLSLAEAIHDPLAHAPAALIDASVALATGQCINSRR